MNEDITKNVSRVTRSVFSVFEHIVLYSNTTSQTEAQRKLYSIILSYVMASYWAKEYQQKLINHYHADMIEWLCGKFKDKNELMEVVNMFEPLTYADDSGLIQDRRVIKCVDDLIHTLPDIYDEWVRRNDKMKHDDLKSSSHHLIMLESDMRMKKQNNQSFENDDDDVYTDSSNSENN